MVALPANAIASIDSNLEAHIDSAGRGCLVEYLEYLKQRKPS